MKTGRWPAAMMALTSEGSVNKGRATPDPGFRSSPPSSSGSACLPLCVQNFGLSPSNPNASGGGPPRKIATSAAAKSAGVYGNANRGMVWKREVDIGSRRPGRAGSFQDSFDDLDGLVFTSQAPRRPHRSPRSGTVQQRVERRMQLNRRPVLNHFVAEPQLVLMQAVRGKQRYIAIANCFQRSISGRLPCHGVGEQVIREIRKFLLP